MSDEEALANMEIDLEVAGCCEVLESHGVAPDPDLVSALWDWMEALRTAGGDASG